MKREIYQVAFPVTLVVVMVAFLSTIFLANANLSFAASDNKNSSAVARISAVDHAEARIKQLQVALNITDAQKPLWNNLTQVMRENAEEMDALTKDMRENTMTMNAVERMKFHNQISESRLIQQTKFLPVFEALYASMSDAQKKTTDTIFQNGFKGEHKRK